ncbi:hypothetical protein ACFX4S_15040 [Kosakonia sp. YIM B13605]|uniref:hypothetical protein n=1 Tax=Kosakonia TaxID=1330547 RepID=UPI0028A65A51|nr:hypothetical protein [Kosakonia sacchari]
MKEEVSFSLSYEELYLSAETVIRETLQVTSGPVMKDDMLRGELRGLIRLWDKAAVKTGRGDLDLYRDKRRLQKLAGLPEGKGDE